MQTLNQNPMTLEQKIRKAIPELMELGVGCEIYGVDGDFHQFGEKAIVVGYSEDFGYTKTKILDCYTIERSQNISFTTKIHFNTYNVEIIGKPIQLNHVLEYVRTKDIEFYYTWKFNHLISLWNLKSNLLSDQSDELKNFINELA